MRCFCSFPSIGTVYRLKVWPRARIQGRGKAMVNLLPLQEGERITTVLPLPEDENSWAKLQVLFATKSGDVRRNELSDFANIHKTGKIAMKLEAGDGIIGVQLCTKDDDVLLTMRKAKCIRLPSLIFACLGPESTASAVSLPWATGGEPGVAWSWRRRRPRRGLLRQSAVARRAATGEAEALTEEIASRKRRGGRTFTER
jgi:DNA gyrase subunit A